MGNKTMATPARKPLKDRMATSLQRYNASEKRKKVAELRTLYNAGDEHWTWANIAKETGYSDGPHAHRAYQQYCENNPSLEAAQVRREFDEYYWQAKQRLESIINNPPPKVGSTSIVAFSCTCGAAARGVKAQHDNDCDRHPIPDMSIVTQAEKELRQLNLSYVKIHNGERPKPREIAETEAWQQATQFLRTLDLKNADNPDYVLPDRGEMNRVIQGELTDDNVQRDNYGVVD